MHLRYRNPVSVHAHIAHVDHPFPRNSSRLPPVDNDCAAFYPRFLRCSTVLCHSTRWLRLPQDQQSAATKIAWRISNCNIVGMPRGS